jgi:hypothetical protein
MEVLDRLFGMSKAMAMAARSCRSIGDVQDASLLQSAIQRVVDVNLAKDPPPTMYVQTVMESMQAAARAVGH